MFGRKKEITQNLIFDSKNEEDPQDINSQGKEKTKQPQTTNNNNTDNKFIFYGNDNKFAKQLEIYATLKGTENITSSKNKRLVLIVIDSQSTINLLRIKIRESFYQFPEYQNLEGLQATNLTKKSEKKSEEKILQEDGVVGDILRNGDIVFFELQSDEIWIKVNINMINVSNKIQQKLNVSMDTKINKSNSFKELIYILLKCAINCWLEQVPNVNLYHYIVTELNISAVIGQKEENNMKIDQPKEVGEIFGFKDSIKLDIKFNSLEYIFFQKLKYITRLPSDKLTYKKKALWDEYKGLKFKEFLNKPNFVDEKNYIFEAVNKLMNTKNNKLHLKCNVYYQCNDGSEVAETENEDNDSRRGTINFPNSKEDEDSCCDFRRGSDVIVKDQINSNLIVSKNSKDITTTNLNSSQLSSCRVIKKNEKLTLIIVPDTNNKGISRKISFAKFKNRNINNNINIGEISKEHSNTINDENIANDLSISNLDFNKNRRVSYQSKEQKEKIELIHKTESNKQKTDKSSFGRTKKDEKKGKGDMTSSRQKNSINFRADFEKYFDKGKFVDFISGLYMINVPRGVIEITSIPEFRLFKVLEDKDVKPKIKKKRKRRKKINQSYSYVQNYPLSRIHIELFIFVVLVYAILVYLVILINKNY